MAGPASAIDGGMLRLNTFNGWSAFEVISQGDNPAGDGFNFSMPGTFDGAGAWLVDPSTLRIQVNHEISDASISEVNIDLAAFESVIENMISVGSTGGESFVQSARQAYDRWSPDGGTSFIATSNTSNTSFGRFCSAQAYEPNTFGHERGFVDHIYVTGEEFAGDRLFAVDSANRDFYLLSGQAGSALGGVGGIPFDSYENAALVDTGETEHIALLLSPDGGTETLRLYVGEKGKDPSGAASSSFLARNGLAYGSWYYLNATFPALGSSNAGSFTTSSSGALASAKLEDVDTSPGAPTWVVLGDQTDGVFTFEMTLDFSTGSFDAATSGFTITKVSNTSGGANSVDNPDNVDWTDRTTLGGTTYPDGLIFVNEDNSSGEIWVMNPDGTGKVRIASTTVGSESSGIFDVSSFVGYMPGSILITNNQGSPASMSVLINPDATLSAADPIISGTIRDGVIPLSGVSVVADAGGGSGTTDSSGTYAISVPMNWSGTITPALADYDMVPPSRTYTDVLADDPGEDYAATFNPDLSPPTPNPMTFDVLPTPLSSSSITMTASVATDPSAPVEYFFECTSDASASSSWQASTTYVAIGLMEETLYSFEVRARDAALNESSASAAASTTTPARPPEVAALGAWQDGLAPGYSHPAPSGAKRVLLVFGHSEANAAPTDFTSVDYGGQPLTQVVERLQNQNNSYSATAEIWILDGAGIQAASSSVISASTSGAAETRRISSVFYEGVDQGDPTGPTGTSGENANETQTLSVVFSGGELDAGDIVVANNTVRNDQNGDTSWTWLNGLTPMGAFNPSGSPYLTYSVAQVLADDSAETVTVDVQNNGVGALAAVVLNHAEAEVSVCGNDVVEGGEACDDGNLVDGDCCSATCTFEPSTTICRTSAGLCDLVETCDGSGACLPDVYQSAATPCRVASGDCDVLETCTGLSASCPADVFAPAMTECRAAVGVCDVAEMCTGADAACPADALLDGVPCLDGDACNGAEQCVAGVCESAVSLECDDQDACTADACDAITGCSHTLIPSCAIPVPGMSEANQVLSTLLMIWVGGILLALRRGHAL